MEKRWWDFPAALFLVVALTTVAYRLTDTKWTDNLEIVIALTFIGVILGLGLGYSRLNHHVAGIFGLLYTLFFVPWQLLEAGTTANYTWLERVWLLGYRLWTNLTIFLRNEPLSDSFLFLATMALLFWLLAITSGYNLTRYGKPWHGLIITGIAMLMIDLYHPPLAIQGVATAVYTVLALLMVTRVFFLKRAHQWEVNQVGVDSDTGFNLIRGAFIAVLVMVLLAWNAPNIVRAFTPNTPERRRLIQTWQEFRQRFENMATPLRGSVTVPTEFYADEFALGTGSNLTDQTVFTVTPSIEQRAGIAFYWRVRSYDTYENGRWESTINAARTFSPSDPDLQYPDLNQRLVMAFRFRPARNLSMLFVPGLPMEINRPVTLVYDGTDNQILDVITVTSNPMIRPGTVYDVSVSLAAPTIRDMREASQDYPEWVREKYLQLPPDLPASIPALAAEITQGLDNPYDKVAAITLWLRNNIEYSPTIPTPPAGRDPVEWVLFEHKQGFCNYYASAHVLMLRSLGIPARWVVGYAQGEHEPEENYYWVRDKDRHAWPEVYFPGLGWVEFEPTAFQSDIQRPSGETNDRTPFTPDESNRPMLLEDYLETLEFQERQDLGAAPVEDQVSPATTAITLIIAAVLLTIAAVYFIAGRARRRTSGGNTLPALIERTFRKRGWTVPEWIVQWSAFSNLMPIERAYYSVAWMIRILGTRPSPAWTPNEEISTLVNLVPKGRNYANVLLQEYQKAVYSPHPANVQAAQDASLRLWRLTLQKRFEMILGRVFPDIYSPEHKFN